MLESIVEIYEQAYASFWTERYWLSTNTSWKAFENTKDGPYSHISKPELWELAWCFPVAILLSVVRHYFERIVMRPIAIHCGLQDEKRRPKRPEHCPKLEKFFKRNKRPSEAQMQTLSLDLNWSLKRVQNWFRLQRNLQKSSKLRKFSETGWRFTFFFLVLAGGVYVLHDEDFFYEWSLAYDILSIWPQIHVEREFLYYYVIELGFYFSLIFSLFSDVRRSDFIEHCIHHAVAIYLMFASYAINFVRLGLLLLIIHDPADSWLEAAKMARYVGRRDLSAMIFAVFVLVWIVTRTIAYPLLLIYPCWCRYLDLFFESGHIYSIFTNLCLMTVLVVLNSIWTVFIIASAYRGLTSDFDDARSGSESESESTENETTPNGFVTNGRKKKVN